MLGGIPLGVAIHYCIPKMFAAQTVAHYSLGNQFVEAGISQACCVLLLVAISMATTPRPAAETAPLLWKWRYLWLPEGEPKRAFLASVPFWWGLFVVFYVCVVIYLW